MKFDRGRRLAQLLVYVFFQPQCDGPGHTSSPALADLNIWHWPFPGRRCQPLTQALIRNVAGGETPTRSRRIPGISDSDSASFRVQDRLSDASGHGTRVIDQIDLTHNELDHNHSEHAWREVRGSRSPDRPGRRAAETVDAGSPAASPGSGDDRSGGASPVERTAGRLGYRAGYDSRGPGDSYRETGAAGAERPRRAVFDELFARDQRSEQALVSALAEMYVQGAPPRIPVLSRCSSSRSSRSS